MSAPFPAQHALLQLIAGSRYVPGPGAFVSVQPAAEYHAGQTIREHVRDCAVTSDDIRVYAEAARRLAAICDDLSERIDSERYDAERYALEQRGVL